MIRKASAVWNGHLKGGRGTLSTQSGLLSNIDYSFATRFENKPGTNPEELIGAAHAGCFSMALAGELGKLNLTPETINTEAHVTLEETQDGYTITKIHLDVSAKVRGQNIAPRFNEAVTTAKNGCPVSRLIKAEITVDAKLDESEDLYF